MGRCWGRTRNFTRCQRCGDWRFFCHEHKWQPLIGAFSVVAFVGSVASIYSCNAGATKQDIRDSTKILQSQQGAEISKLQHTVLSLQERSRPRMLTGEQEEVFLGILRKAPSGIVTLFWLSNNLEAETFTKHLAVLLESVDWTVSKYGYEANETPVGIEIHVQSAESAPPYTALLREALKSVGYETSLVENHDSPLNNWLWLVVGHTP